MNSGKSDIAKRVLAKIKPENKIFVRKNIAISNQIETILNKRGWSQKQFAEKLGKNESEVSKWMSGLHNLTLQSIAKIEAVLGEDLI